MLRIVKSQSLLALAMGAIALSGCNLQLQVINQRGVNAKEEPAKLDQPSPEASQAAAEALEQAEEENGGSVAMEPGPVASEAADPAPEPSASAAAEDPQEDPVVAEEPQAEPPAPPAPPVVAPEEVAVAADPEPTAEPSPEASGDVIQVKDLVVYNSKCGQNGFYMMDDLIKMGNIVPMSDDLKPRFEKADKEGSLDVGFDESVIKYQIFDACELKESHLIHYAVFDEKGNHGEGQILFVADSEPNGAIQIQIKQAEKLLWDDIAMDSDHEQGVYAFLELAEKVEDLDVSFGSTNGEFLNVIVLQPSEKFQEADIQVWMVTKDGEKVLRDMHISMP